MGILTIINPKFILLKTQFTCPTGIATRINKRGVVDECCRHQCSFATLQTYCVNDTDSEFGEFQSLSSSMPYVIKESTTTESWSASLTKEVAVPSSPNIPKQLPTLEESTEDLKETSSLSEEKSTEKTTEEKFGEQALNKTNTLFLFREHLKSKYDANKIKSEIEKEFSLGRSTTTPIPLETTSKAQTRKIQKVHITRWRFRPTTTRPATTTEDEEAVIGRFQWPAYVFRNSIRVATPDPFRYTASRRGRKRQKNGRLRNKFMRHRYI